MIKYKGYTVPYFDLRKSLFVSCATETGDVSTNKKEIELLQNAS